MPHRYEEGLGGLLKLSLLRGGCTGHPSHDDEERLENSYSNNGDGNGGGTS